ncbi:MAG: hypothetical protein RR795_01385 [Cetobacterium sp.]|uniref:hypothetical protein n=1 Tax=Cetobacterium sp. TaxID=2071632 RepID=UPI002FC5BC0E
MIKIKGQLFNSRDFKPSHYSSSDEFIKNDRKIASDNIQVSPLSISSIIFYKAKNYENYNDKIIFIEDIIYNQELISIEDVDAGRIYNVMYISKFNITKLYIDGFVAEIEFGYVPITETAVEGQKEYKGYSSRNVVTVDKPLKSLSIPKVNLPTVTLDSLKSVGVDTSSDILNLKALDFGSIGNISDKIMTKIGDYKGVFELAKDGVFDVLDTAGNYVSMGQKLISNAELFANTIPGVNISLKLLPITQRASEKIFDIKSLGKEFEIITTVLEENVGDIIDY